MWGDHQRDFDIYRKFGPVVQEMNPRQTTAMNSASNNAEKACEEMMELVSKNEKRQGEIIALRDGVSASQT